MQLSRLAFAVAAFLTMKTTALPVNGTIDSESMGGYRIIDLEWEIEPSPGAETITINGTVETVIAHLNNINPTWKRDFEVTPSVFRRSAEEETAAVRKRYITRIDCSSWESAKWGGYYTGVRHLYGVPGRPRNGPGPGACGRVSCDGGAAIWWCNDQPFALTLNGFYNIADMARDWLKQCDDTWLRDARGGQIFESGNWNVIMRGNVC